MYEAQDFEEISARMLSNVEDKFDKREGSVIYDAIAPTALELAFFYTCLDMVMDEVFADTASYYYLIKRAAERGIFPREETQAVLKMEITPANAAITAGDRFNLNELNYTVVKAVDNEPGAYQVECESAGAVGNQQLGLLLPLETAKELNDLETAELTGVLIPGEDEEDVEVFRKRYFSSFDNKAFGGNQADYQEKVTGMDGVGGCKIIRAWEKGYDPSQFIPDAAVAGWYESVKDTLPNEVKTWLGAVYTAASEKLLTTGGTVKVIIITSEFKVPSQTLVNDVQAALDPDEAGEGMGLAPIGHVVNVSGVVAKTVDISVSFTFQMEYSFTALQDAICMAVDNYFHELSQSWAEEEHLIVRVSEIETRLLKITGITDIAHVKLNEAESNLVLAEDEIPVRGSLNG